MSANKIIYTITDEAPALATASLLPIVQAFTRSAGIEVETRDISLAGRILALFPEVLNENQRINDDLAELGSYVIKPEANVIKLPNISASVPQLKDAIAELQSKGYAIPDYMDEPKTETEIANNGKYAKVMGSAVNPVLREGNSDRRAPKPVKMYAKSHPHSMGKWTPSCTSHVSTMSHGDFRSNEKSMTASEPMKVDIQHMDEKGNITKLKSEVSLKSGEIFDTTFMSKNALVDFLNEQVNDAREKNVLFSIHMKATMMKVSDPIIFGHAVKAYFAPLFEKHASIFDQLNVNVNNGFGDLLEKIETLDAATKDLIKKDIDSIINEGPALAMVNSEKGITNLHVPSDVIVDASMPAMIRNSGQMWNAAGKSQDTKAVIPDSTYAGIYQVVIDFCKEHGAFDPATMGTVPNVGLMAQKAEEYGSHDKTFEITAKGQVQVIKEDGTVLMSHSVEQGDIWRMCTVKDDPIKDWIKLAVTRARLSNTPVVFWLDKNRPHDAELIKKIETNLPLHDTNGLDIKILSPMEATLLSIQRIKEG
ncbi:MAG: hypothetical protein RLZZ546_2901, partial [Bacteroidota bacterium]